MIHLVSETVFRWLEREGAIPTEHYALFVYAVRSLIFGMLPFIIITILGVAVGMLQEGLLMVLTFMVIRKFSGGFHLKSAKHCIPFSIFILAITLGAIKVINGIGQINTVSRLLLVSVLIICSISPIDNEARRLTPKETRVFKTISRIISLGVLLIYFGLLSVSLDHIAIPIATGIVLAAILQLPCVILSYTQKASLLSTK